MSIVNSLRSRYCRLSTNDCSVITDKEEQAIEEISALAVIESANSPMTLLRTHLTTSFYLQLDTLSAIVKRFTSTASLHITNYNNFQAPLLALQWHRNYVARLARMGRPFNEHRQLTKQLAKGIRYAKSMNAELNFNLSFISFALYQRS